MVLGRTEPTTLDGGRLGLAEPDTLGWRPSDGVCDPRPPVMLGRTELATLGGGRLGLTEPDTLGGSPMSKAAPSRSMIEGAGEPAPALGAGGVCDTCPLSKAAPSLSMTEGAGEPARLGRTEPATLGAVGSHRPAFLAKVSRTRGTIFFFIPIFF